jgi:aspartyl protease family protein
MSQATRRALLEGASWGFAIATLVAMAYYHQDIRTVSRKLFGIDAQRPAAQSARAPKEPAPQTSGGRTIELRADSRGHFSADAEINGRRIQVMVDTGATIVALTFQDAERLGIYMRDSDFTHRVNTANGVARVAPTTLDRVAIGNVMVRNVSAAVVERGKMSQTLLGMSFLGKLHRVDMRAGRLVLEE